VAGRGPAPGRNPNVKGADQRSRRNHAAPVAVLVADGKVYGPELPDDYDWPAATLEWWQTWRTSAQASKFIGTDWSFLIDTAVLHADFWLGNRSRSVAAELRLREAKFGATLEDRARLRWQVGEADVPPAPVARLQAKAERSRLFIPPRPTSAEQDG
jgi:hypothetical protein